MRLSTVTIQQIKQTGITGALSTYTGIGQYGSGKKSYVTLIMQGPVREPIELREPDATSVVYIQDGKDWKMFPSNARMLERTIRIEPDTHVMGGIANNPNQSSVMVELATGALQGFGVWWPEAKPEGPDK
jgi:hypothetical protein